MDKNGHGQDVEKEFDAFVKQALFEAANDYRCKKGFPPVTPEENEKIIAEFEAE